MTTAKKELAVTVEGFLVPMFGEQYSMWTEDDGDVRFDVCVGAAPVGLIVEPVGEDGALLVGFHIIGVKVEDKQAAAAWVAKRNQQIRVDRVQMFEDDVVFLHSIFGPGVNKDCVRILLGLLAGESRSHADLAAATGALTLADLVALDNLGDI